MVIIILFLEKRKRKREEFIKLDDISVLFGQSGVHGSGL